MRTLEAVRPDIYVKGGDYEIAQLPEAARIKEWGGRAVIIPFVEGFSTTHFLQRARAP